jgi:hypothetical protein
MAQGGRGAPGAGRGIFTGHDFHARINNIMNMRSYSVLVALQDLQDESS